MVRSVDACVSHRRLRKDSDGPRLELYTLYGTTRIDVCMIKGIPVEYSLKPLIAISVDEG